LQDCELCNRLAAKLEILANNAGMANVCLVPLSFIFMRGQGIKIFSLVAKRCRDDGFLVPTRYQAPRPGDRGYVAGAGGGGEDEEEEGYEGAIVLEPEVGMYLEQPVSVLDYNSLYPSSMISHNLSHDSLVVDEAYDRLPGLEYSEVVYDRYEGKGDEKRVVGQQVQAASCKLGAQNAVSEREEGSCLALSFPVAPRGRPHLAKGGLFFLKRSRRRTGSPGDARRSISGSIRAPPGEAVSPFRSERAAPCRQLPLLKACCRMTPKTLPPEAPSQGGVAHGGRRGKRGRGTSPPLSPAPTLCPRLALQVCRFARGTTAAPGAPGVLSCILQDLLAQRKATRARMKGVEDEFRLAVLDGLQLAYKVTANSLYGQMGARTSPLYLKHVAACTTAVGRSMIMQAKAFVEGPACNGHVIYGDTDSIFIVFKNVDAASGEALHGRDALAASIRQGQAASKGIKPFLPPPHNLEYEKTMFPLLLLSKKRYVGLLYEDDPDAVPKQKSMGIALRRRDYAGIVKQIYGGMIDIVLRQRDLPRAVEFLRGKLKDLAEGRYDLEDLVISKNLRSYYKFPHQIAHWVLARRMYERDPGSAPQVTLTFSLMHEGRCWDGPWRGPSPAPLVQEQKLDQNMIVPSCPRRRPPRKVGSLGGRRGVRHEHPSFSEPLACRRRPPRKVGSLGGRGG